MKPADIRFSRVLISVLLTAICGISDAQVALWKKRLEFMGNHDIAHRVATDGNGNVFVAGSTDDGSNLHDLLYAMYSSDGQLQWTRKFGRSDSSEWLVHASLDPQGNLVMAGRKSLLGSAELHYLIVKVDPDGRFLWSRTPSTASPAELTSMAIDPAGNILVTGRTGQVHQNQAFTTMKYAPDGTRLWVRRFVSVGYGDMPQRVQTDLSGNVYVCGDSSGNEGDLDCMTLKYDPNGNLQWSRRYNSPDDWHENVTGSTVDAQGNLVVVAQSWETQNLANLAILKYSPSGALLWTRLYGRHNDQLDWQGKVVVDEEDNILIGAWRYSQTATDYLVMKYEPNGTLRWLRRYDGPVSGDDYLYDIITDGGGNVYVTGGSQSTASVITGLDIATLKYNADGQRQWLRRYDGPSHLRDAGQSIVIAPDGSVVVTGMSVLASIDLPPDADFMTIKYSAGS